MVKSDWDGRPPLMEALPNQSPWMPGNGTQESVNGPTHVHRQPDDLLEVLGSDLNGFVARRNQQGHVRRPGLAGTHENLRAGCRGEIVPLGHDLVAAWLQT